jgi:hypothetical protein
MSFITKSGLRGWWGAMTALVALICCLSLSPTKVWADTGTGATKCELGLIGVIICDPLEKLQEFVNDTVKELVNDAMQVRFLMPGTTTSSGENTTDKLFGYYENFRTAANVLLAIGLLMIIYATAVVRDGTGLWSNYNVKKVLPRLILLAIAVNTSFYLCAALVDIFNILGEGILVWLTGGSTPAATQIDVTSVLTSVMMAIVIILNFGVFILAVIVLLGLILLRQILLAICIVISPLAFALWLFPNTDKYAQKWWDMFLQLLIMYPIVMLIWGFTSMVSDVMKAT